MTRLRRVFAAGFGLAAGALAVVAPASAEPGADELRVFLDAVAACTNRPTTLTLAIVGTEPEQVALGREAAEEVRLAVETRLVATGRVRLAAAADVVRVKALREGTTGLAPAEAEAQIRTAFAGDASVFLVSPARAGGTATVRLQAITRDAGCKATSEPIVLPIRVGQGVADVDAVLAKAVGALNEAAPNTDAIALCPIVAAGGHSDCAGVLTDRLAITLDTEARSPNRVLRGRPLAVRRLPAGEACPEAGLSARGQFSTDRTGGAWLAVEFRRDGAVLAPSARQRIDPAGLGCDPTPRPFLDHLLSSGRSDAARLAVAAAATPFARGQRLDLRIESGARQRMYCWVVAQDETAFVALPVRGEAPTLQPLGPGDVRRYPRGYGLDEIVAAEPFENLFSCFGVEGGLPPEVENRWLSAAPGADGPARLLQPPEVMDLLERLRAVPGVTEAAARIVVR